MDAANLLKQMKDSIQEGEWAWLAPHHARGALIVVAQDLDLAEVGVKVSTDAVAEVSGWLSEGQLARPTQEQAESWDQNPDRHFRFLIVQPYVLIQSMGH